MAKLKILLTNDDGIHAKGIRKLWLSLKKSLDCEIFIVAPISNQSGVGMSFSYKSQVIVESFQNELEPLKTWVVHGTPVDCVKIATNILLKDSLPDIILSGVNHGSNAGKNVLYSGTVGAALEGCIKNIPSIALSQVHGIIPLADHTLEKYLPPLIRYLLNNPLPPHYCLNVNFPDVKEIKGIKLILQGREVFKENPQLIKYEENKYHYSISSFKDPEIETPSEEYTSLLNGFITVVPITTDNLPHETIFGNFEKRSENFCSFFN